MEMTYLLKHITTCVYDRLKKINEGFSKTVAFKATPGKLCRVKLSISGAIFNLH